MNPRTARNVREVVRRPDITDLIHVHNPAITFVRERERRRFATFDQLNRQAESREAPPEQSQIVGRTPSERGGARMQGAKCTTAVHGTAAG